MYKLKTLAISFILLLNITLNDSLAKSKTKKVKLTTAGKIYVPKTVNSFKLSDTKKYKEVDLGVGFKYTSDKLPQVIFDYYIYPMYEQISIEDMMIVEYQNVIKGIKTLSEKDDGIVSILHEELISINDQQIIKATINIDNKFGNLISELYLTSIRGHYVKARVSYPMHDSKEFALRTEVEDVFKQLLSGTIFKSKKDIEYIFNIYAEDFQSDNKELMTTAIMYAATVQSKSSPNLVFDFDRYYDIYSILAKLNDETIDEKGSRLDVNDYIDHIDVNEAGYLKEFIWLAYNRPYWVEPKDLKLNSFREWLAQYKSKKFITRPVGISILIKR